MDDSRGMVSLLNLVAAREAARGHLDLAESVVASMHRLCGPTAKGLDLLARIAVSRGDRDRALGLWKESYRLDATDEGCKKAIECLQRIGTKPLWLFAPASYGVAISVMAAMVILILGTQSLIGPDSASTTKEPPPPKAVSAPIPSIPEARFSLTATEIGLQDFEGCKVQTLKDGVAISFPEGLFSEGVEFLPSAPTILHQVGSELSNYPRTLVIAIQGSTDSKSIKVGSFFKSNDELAFQRALRVIQEMEAHSKSHLRKTEWKIVAPGNLDAFLGHHEEGTSLRSAVLMISLPAGKCEGTK